MADGKLHTSVLTPLGAVSHLPQLQLSATKLDFYSVNHTCDILGFNNVNLRATTILKLDVGGWVGFLRDTLMFCVAGLIFKMRRY